MKRFCTSILMWTLGLTASAAPDKPASGVPAELLGTWTGTWEGAGSSGGIDLTIEKSKEDTSGARVAVTGEPTYQANVRTIAFDGKTMTAVYDYPPDPAVEVKLTATFEGEVAKGSWSARRMPDGGDLASGTWTVKKKK